MAVAGPGPTPSAFRWLEQGTRLVTILTGAVGAVLALNGFLEYQTRLIYWCILGALFGFAALQKRPPAPAAGLRPAARDPRWWLGTAACVVALAGDVFVNRWMTHPMVQVSNTEFEPNFFDESSNAPRGYRSVLPFRNVKADRAAKDADSDCRDWFGVPKEEWLGLVKNRARLYVDNIDMKDAMTPTTAAALYFEDLEESFKFRIRKRPRHAEVAIENVAVTVHKFISCLPPLLERRAQMHRDIIVVELSQQNCEKLPWRFGAKYLLPDPQKQTVIPWDRAVLTLRDDFEQSYLVKIGAKDPGIYVYTVDLIVRGDWDRTQRIPLVSSPRAVFFYGDMQARQEEREAFWKNIGQQDPEYDLTRGVPFAVPGPTPSDSQAPAAPTPAPSDPQ